MSNDPGRAFTVYEAIEDEFCIALESGNRPPREFTLHFDEPEFLALLGSIIQQDGTRFPVNTGSVLLRLFGHDVTVVRVVTLSEP